MSLSCPRCGCVFERPPGQIEATRIGNASSSDELPCPQCGELVSGDFLELTLPLAPAHEDRAGTQISHFVLLRRLGAGAFGEVWLAEDITLGRQVAIKLPKFVGLESSFTLNEAKTAASLKHDNIVRVLEVGNEGNLVFIASEYIDGLTLQDLLSTGKPTEQRILELLIPIAEALDFAHQAGVIHRDIKPANILLNRDGRPYVADFGIARRINADATISHEGQVIGTARYMSPEQASGKSKETDRRSDIYSIGVMLFEMLTGDVPFRGNLQAILHQKTVEEAPSPRTLNPTVSRDLETICLRCLEREPGRRYASAREVAEELQRVHDGEPIQARPISRIERAWRWCRRRPAVAGLLASLFLSLSLGMFGVTYFWIRAEERGHAARRSLYHSWMNLASVHLSNGDYAGMQQILKRVSEASELRELRGFEWDYFDATTAPLFRVANYGDAVRDIALSRDGEMCASSGQESEIRVWDANSGEVVRVLDVAEARAQSLEFSPTASLLASGGTDGYVRLWQPGLHARTLQQMKHGPPVTLVRFAPAGDRLLSLGISGAVRLWSVPEGTRIAEIPTGKRGETRDARFSPDGKRLYVATQDGHIRVWNLDQLSASPVPEHEFDLSYALECLALSDDGDSLIAGNYHGQLTIHSLSTGAETTFLSQWGRIDDLEFIKGTRTLLTVSSDGQLHVFDIDRNHEVRALHTHGLHSGVLARSADGASIAIGSGDGTVTRIKLADIRRPRIYWHENAVRELCLFSDTQEVLDLDNAGVIRLWNLDKGESTEFLKGGHDQFQRLAAAPDCQLLALAGVGGTVAICDRKQAAITQRISTSPSGVAAMQFSPDGGLLALALRDGRVQVYKSGEWSGPLLETESIGDSIRTLEFCGQGATLAVARSNHVIEFLDPTTGRARWPAIKLSAEPCVLQACDQNHLLAIATTNGEIHLWDTRSLQHRFVIKGHTGRINALACLPDGRTLVSGGRDRHLKLWDLTSAELIAPLTGHSRQVFAIAAAPDGKTIYSGGLDGEIRIWQSRREQ